MIYDPEITLGEARAEYFRRSGFSDDGGYSDRWIKVKVWRVPIWLPNTAGRVEAVKLHDLHHVLTEYPTTWRGEAEISAWEIGSGGLRSFWEGWWLDLMNVAQGLIVNPGGVYRGFMRGRQSENLFASEFNDRLLGSAVGEYRHRLGLEHTLSSPSLSDYAAFVFWVTLAVLIYLISVGVPVALISLLVYWIIFW
ncbi:MAG: hypothetical protein H0X08_05170 [Blastocatellia bacterium]|nr:hypothetical protein [Blastocatellia bacterium]